MSLGCAEIMYLCGIRHIVLPFVDKLIYYTKNYRSFE